MSKLKIVGNSEGLGTFTIISPNSDSNAAIELPHSSGTLVTNSQDLIPTQDEVYDLGSSSKAFKDLHISATTIFLGTQPISANSTGIVLPQVTIGSGNNAVKLKASDDGKLKQVSTDSAGVELPEVDIPQELIDLTDVIDTAPSQGQTLIWNNTTSKFEYSILPEVFSDFTDVDITTTPPTDTQVLTWNNANNEWSAGNNGFPLIVANTTELLALTGMLVGQEAFVTDLNRSYTYTGSTPNDKWRHAVSGWYATDSVMTNHPMTEITGIDSTYSLDQSGIPLIITALADDPDQKPITWTTNATLNGANVDFIRSDNVFTITQQTAPSIPTSPVDIVVNFYASDDSLDQKFFTTTISALKLYTSTSWKNSQLVKKIGGHLSLTHAKSVAINSDGTTLLISNSKYNRVDVWDRDVATGDWNKNPAAGGPSVAGMPQQQFPEWAGTLYISQIRGVTEEFPNGQYDALGLTHPSYGSSAGPFHPEGIYGGSMQTRFGYIGRTVALSADGLTAAVACTGETIGADIWEPNGSEELPYVDIFNRDPQTKIWTRVAHKLSPSAYDPTATTWIGDDGGQAISEFNINTDLNKPPSTWHSGTRGAGSGGVIVPAAGMTIALSEKGTTLVVGYRLEGPKLTTHNQYADKSATDGTNSTPDPNWYNWGAVYIYQKDSNNNWSLDTKLHGGIEAGSFGASVDIAGDLTTIQDLGLNPTASTPTPTGQALTIVGTGDHDNNRSPGYYTGVTGTSDHNGTGATFNIAVSSTGRVNGYTVYGSGGSAAGVTITSPGTGYIRTENITISDADLGGGGAPDVIFNVQATDAKVAGTYTNLTGTTNGSGTGATFDIVIDANGIPTSITSINQGTGYDVGDVITFSNFATPIISPHIDPNDPSSGYEPTASANNNVNNSNIHPNSTPFTAVNYDVQAVVVTETGTEDTRRIIVSTPNINGGLAQVFEKTDVSGTAWRARSGIYPPDYFNTAVNKTNNRFGFNSISISRDGTKIAVGDPGQSVTNVIQSNAPYGAGDLTTNYLDAGPRTNTTGKVVSTNEFTSNFTYPAGVVYMYEKTGTSNQWFQGDNASDTWALQTNGIVENFIGVSGDGFGDTVDLNSDGTVLSVGASYEHNGFYFPGAYVGAKYINEYTAKRVFHGWHRFSHNGPFDHPASQSELDAWNYTEATQAINCTVNSSTYIGFVTPADGKVDAFDLSVSFTSKNDWDNDSLGIVIAFNIDANGREHTISLIRSGGGIGYVYGIVYNYLNTGGVDTAEQVIFNGANLINDKSFVWGSTVPTTGEGQFVRNRIVRSGDTFTVTTSQLLHPNSHTGTNSDLDSSTTHTFSLGSYSFGDLFSVANGGARWGFSCHSQDLASWVNVELADAINPEEISDTGAVHIYQKNETTSVFESVKRIYPSETFHYCAPDASEPLDGIGCSVTNGPQKLTDCHMGKLALSSDGKILASGYKINRSGHGRRAVEDYGQCEIWEAPFAQNPPTPITLAAPYTGFTTLGTPLTASGHALPNNGINYALPHSTVITATSTDPEGGDITWHGALTSGAPDTSGGYVTGGTTITMVDNGDGSAQFTFLTPAYAPLHTFTWTIYATDTSGQSTSYTITYEWKYPVVSSNSMVFYESEPGGENSTNIPNTHTNVTGTDYNWTCPPDVYYVHALCIGGGACNTGSGIGGGGGGLGWKNNIPVVPGQTYPLKVGRGGHGNSNAHSYFISQSTVKGGGGSGSSGGTYIGDGGGNGGGGSILAHGTSTGGCGGGAGGYSGNGGNGSPSAVGVNFPTGVNGSSGSGGAGGGGAHNYGQYATGGGGVGINGQGSSGSGGVWASSTIGLGGAAGGGGSSGQDGESRLGAGSGGDFGGGGSGRNPGSSGDAGGGDGVVKLIWGTGDFGNPTADNAPQWPSTNIPQTNPQFQTDAQKGI